MWVVSFVPLVTTLMSWDLPLALPVLWEVFYKANPIQIMIARMIVRLVVQAVSRLVITVLVLYARWVSIVMQLKRHARLVQRDLRQRDHKRRTTIAKATVINARKDRTS